MKKEIKLLVAAVTLFGAYSCSNHDIPGFDKNAALEAKKATYKQAFEEQFGKIDPSNDWGFGKTSTAYAKTRAFGDYETSAAFAAKAGAVKAYTPTYAAAPAVPEGAESIEMPNPWNADAAPVATTFKGGHSYVINGDESVLGNMGNYYGFEGEGTVDVYVKSGVVLPEMLNTDNGRINYYILEGATLTTTKASKGLYNWGTVNQNGLYQYNYAGEQVIENYGDMNFTGTIQVECTLYNSKDMSALLKGNGALYVDGDLVAEDGFGLAGKLYVGGEMSGDININNALAAHVGSINTTGKVFATAGSQLMVEGDIVAPSMQLDGSNNGVVETVVKGTADIAGDIFIASGTKAYFEILKGATYTANASEIWIGCKSDVTGKFELNGNSKMTLANGVYLHAGEANFAADTYMDMMSKSYFKVDRKLQLNNANTNTLEGTGTDLAIVKAATMGANYEDFVNTFKGNIGVEFEAWDYNSSTGLIDQNVNLKRMSDLADVYEIAASDCNPGFTGSKVKPEDPDPDPEPEPRTVVNSWRIFSEDMGSIGDFDFNDVVFDVVWYSDNTTEVQLQAAGGTFDSMLEVPAAALADPDASAQIDIHQAFGVNPGQMVNTGSGSVNGKTAEPILLNGHIDHGAIKIKINDKVNPVYEIESKFGEAPGKIAVNRTDVQWSDERINIKTTYPKFADYVGDRTVEWWVK